MSTPEVFEMWLARFREWAERDEMVFTVSEAELMSFCETLEPDDDKAET
jgi:hypothetical protein